MHAPHLGCRSVAAASWPRGHEGGVQRCTHGGARRVTFFPPKNANLRYVCAERREKVARSKSGACFIHQLRLDQVLRETEDTAGTVIKAARVGVEDSVITQ